MVHDDGRGGEFLYQSAGLGEVHPEAFAGRPGWSKQNAW